MSPQVNRGKALEQSVPQSSADGRKLAGAGVSYSNLSGGLMLHLCHVGQRPTGAKCSGANKPQSTISSLTKTVCKVN